EAEGRELWLAADAEVIDLVGHDLELDALTQRLRRHSGSGNAGRQPAGLETDAIAVRCAAALRPQRDEARADLRLPEAPPAACRALERRVFPRSERPGITAVSLEGDEAALAREHVRFIRLQLPERTQPH